MVKGKRVMVPRTCLKCNKPFEADIKTVQTGGAKYCCRKCYAGHKKRVIQERTCPTCGQAFTVDAKQSKTFCNKHCYEKSLSVAMAARTCIWCHKDFDKELRVVKSGEGLCCSRACAINLARARHTQDLREAEARKALHTAKRKLRARGLL